MSEDFNEEGPEAKSKALLEKLKEESYDPSADERYKAGVLRVKLGKLAIKNERNVVHTLHDLVCPAAEDLAAVNNGDAKLRATYKLLIDLWDEPWIHAPRPLEGYAAPQPDYCVGFVRQAFSAEQWRLLDRVPGIAAATDYMHFPFLTCEAKSPKEQIFAAENQNAYNMMVTVSTTVKLFRAAKREMSVHRRVLAFSISYNSTNVSLNGYYPIIVGPRTEIYCTDILDFAISPGAPATWQSWHFVRNIYEVWAPEHLNHLRRAINSLKDTVKDRDEATPTPSESANLGLQQLGLQSPAPHAVQSENPSVCSNPERVKRAETEPPMGSSKRTRID
ncbi:hypothetical protein BK809_0000286 [Diplodia seriata]|uniref:DUF7924 domain-containing protein n=1 Tax=Diplodia seriata TaxID=420778 RepID=A0A1S8BCN9_9PEZI|nr:hypothetical protein BK809_0000286 [Diplodia seriata]